MGNRKHPFCNYRSIIISLPARSLSVIAAIDRPSSSASSSFSRMRVSLVVASLSEPSGRLKSGVHLSTGHIEKWLKHQSRTRRSVPVCAISTRAHVFHCYYFHPSPDRSSVDSSSSFVVISVHPTPWHLRSSTRSPSSPSSRLRRLCFRFRLRLFAAAATSFVARSIARW